MTPIAPGQRQAFAPPKSYCHHATLPKANEPDFLLQQWLKQGFLLDIDSVTELKSDRFHLTTDTIFAQLWHSLRVSERSNLVQLTESGRQFPR